MSDWMTTYLKAAGLPNTKQNRGLLASWQRYEGGHTNNSARFNYLNTTQRMPGSTSMNSVGVQRYRSLGEGARAWAKTIRNGRYEDLYHGFKTGDPYKTNAVRGLSTWLSGSPDSAAGIRYAQKVMGTHVSAPAPGPAAALNAGGSAPGRRSTPPALSMTVSQRPFDFTKLAMKSLNRMAQGWDPTEAFAFQAKDFAAAMNRPQKTTFSPLPGLPAPGKPGQKQRPAGNVQPAKGFGAPVELFYDPIGGIKFGKQIGAIGGHSDHVHYSAPNAAQMMSAIKLARTMGLHVGENPAAGDKVDPVHVAHSYHYRRYPKHKNVGEAIDVSGSPQKMAAFYRRLARGR